MQTKTKNRHGESGNVLFYILIAIALLASLSYAVSQSSRGGGSQITQERANLAASEILDYADILTKAVMQLKLRGCSDTEISFDNPVSGLDYNNTNAPGDESCHVFSFNGGGVTFKEPLAEWLDSSHSALTNYGDLLITGTSCIPFIGTGGDDCHTDGDDAIDLIMIYPYINENICIELNRRANLGTPGANPPEDVGHSWHNTGTSFTGTYHDGKRIRNGGSFDNKKMGCFFKTANIPGAGYHFYKVLIAR